MQSAPQCFGNCPGRIQHGQRHQLCGAAGKLLQTLFFDGRLFGSATTVNRRGYVGRRSHLRPRRGYGVAIPLELTVADDALVVDENRNVKIINPKRASIRHGEGTGNTVLSYRYARSDHVRRQHRTRQCDRDNGPDGGLQDRQQPRGCLQPSQRHQLPGCSRRVCDAGCTSSQIAAGETTAKFSGKSTPTSSLRAATSISWATCSCRYASPPRRWTWDHRHDEVMYVPFTDESRN